MKRILYSCFIFLSLCLTNRVFSQNATYSITPNPICYNASGIYQATAAIVGQVPGATSYSWQIITTATPCAQNVVPFTTGQFIGVTSDAISYTLACCGNYTILCFGWVGATFVGTAAISPILSGGQNQGVIYCPSGATITPTGSLLCTGSSATITAQGAATYTWNDPANTTGSVIVVSPTVNTCYSFTGTTAQGCTVTPPASACFTVQSATVTAAPVSQSMCAGSPVSFTATAGVQTGTNVGAGTSITGYQWITPTPPGTVFATTAIATHTSAIGGPYSVVVTHTGVAGTCTIEAISAVVITTSIPVSIACSSPNFSVCPNTNFTLTANSIQTVSNQHDWYGDVSSSGTPTVFFNSINPLVTFVSTPNLPRTFSVNVNYFGCPGTATVLIGLLTLTPGLVSSALTSCPGQSLTLTGSGASTYTFFEIPAPGGTTLVIPKGLATTNTVVHTPAGSSMPIQYCVGTQSSGCTGTTCIVVNTRTLFPVLSLVAPTSSVCPGTQFTLSSTINGTNVTGPASYTFGALAYNANIGSGPSSTLAHTPPSTNSTLPQTYSVVVDSAGCQGTGTFTVNKLDLKPFLSSSSPSICAGTSLTIMSFSTGAGSTYTFYSSHVAFDGQPTATMVTTGITNTVSHQPPAIPSASLVTYTVAVDSAGCKGTSTHSIGILDLGPTLTLSTIPSSGSVCPGSTVTIKALGSINYSFTAPPSSSTPFYTTTVPTGKDTAYGPANVPAVIPLTGITYTVYADSLSCAGSKTITVFEHKLNPGITLSPTIVCSGMETTISATNVGTGSMVTYTFYTASPTAPVPTTLASAPGSFSTTDYPTQALIYSVVVDSAGCKSVLPPPTATIVLRPDIPLIPSTSAASVCPGLSATLSVAAPTTQTSYTYTWGQTSGSPTTINPVPPISSPSVVTYPISNSTYSIHVIDSLGCVGNTVVTVGIDPAISFSLALASSGTTICPGAGQTVSLTASSTVALNNNSIGTINYTWTPSTALNQTVGTNVISSPSTSVLYTVVADNGYGCVSQNTVGVVVGTWPVVTTPAVYDGVCVGFTSTITAFGANSYTWTGSTFTNAIAQPSIAVGAGSYTVLGSNGGGCTVIATKPIALLPNFTPSITVNTPTTCITSNFPKFSKAVTLNATGGSSYVWFPYSPLHMTYSLGPQTDVRPPVTTIYTVIASKPNCSGTQTLQVTVIPQFTMTVVPPLPAMCLGDSIKLSIVNIGPQGPNGAVGPVSSYSYTWMEALNAPPISISSYFTPTVMVYPQNTTTYSTEVRDSRECISFPRLVTVTVLPRPITAIAIPTINSVATNTVCYVGLNPGAQDVTINLTGNNMNTGLQFGVVPTYTWVSPYDPYISILTPANNNAITVSAPIRVLNNSAVAVYTLISGYNGVPGCKRMDTVSVRVVDCRPVRSIKFTTAEPIDTICARNCITFVNQTDTMAGGPQTYTWTFRGGSPATSTVQNPVVCYNFPGKYDVILQVANPYPKINPTGAAPGSTFAIGTLSYVKVVDIPNVTIVAPGQMRSDTVVRFGQSVNLNGSGALSYEWSPGYNISSLTKPKVTVNPFKTTQYILTGFNSKNCVSSDTINVIVVEDCGEMYVPNAFTPNNDGANDVLYVRGICLQSLTFMVFNRWGEKVFETADQSVGWDGTYKGEEMNTGVFVYRLEGKTYDGKGFSAKGNITLIR